MEIFFSLNFLFSKFCGWCDAMGCEFSEGVCVLDKQAESLKISVKTNCMLCNCGFKKNCFIKKQKKKTKKKKDWIKFVSLKLSSSACAQTGRRTDAGMVEWMDGWIDARL